MKRFKVFRRIFRLHGLRESLMIAIKGFSYLFFYHRNMRIIFLCGIAAFLAGVLLKFQGIELIALCITVTLVFMAEIFNTAIEMICDMATRKFHPLIKLVKDISAAVVLIASINSIGVGFVLFYRHIFK